MHSIAHLTPLSCPLAPFRPLQRLEEQLAMAREDFRQTDVLKVAEGVAALLGEGVCVCV